MSPSNQDLLRICKLWRQYMHDNFSPSEIWFWADTENAIAQAEEQINSTINTTARRVYKC